MVSTRPIHHHDGEAVGRTLLRWSLAAACIVASYGGIVYAALNWPHEAAAARELPAAVMIEFAPLPVAPETPPHDIALGPQMEMSQAATPSEQVDQPVEPETTESVAKPELKTEVEMPPLPEKQNAAAVLAQSTPPEAKPREMPKEPKRDPDKPRNPPKKPQDRAAKNAQATAAPQAADVQRAVTNAAPMAGTSSSTSPSNWRSMVVALLNRHKRPPAGGGRGMVTVAFTIDRSGKVLSARLARSSGDASLDQEAVALARRISPVPAPPADVGSGGSVLLAVPVRFGD